MDGKTLRLKRFMRRPKGRTVILPLDHGVTCGPIEGLDRMDRVIRMGTRGGADGLVIHSGMFRFLETVKDPLPGIFFHLSSSTRLGPSPHRKVLTGSVEEALRLGADGVSVHVNLGGKHEPDMLRDLGRVADSCSLWQMPLLVMIYVKPASDAPVDDTAIAHAARVAAELGADVIKIPAPERLDTLARITQSLPVPIVVAGGGKAPDGMRFLERVKGIIEAGATGLAVGRNIFQHERPQDFLKAVCAVVHEGTAPDQAWSLLEAGA